MTPIDFFWRAAQRWPSRCAIDAPCGRITYAELATRVRALAAGLAALDPRVQSRVAICAKNNANHLVSLLAVLASGKVWVPLNMRSTRQEISRIISITEPSIVIVDEACLQLVDPHGAAALVNEGSSDAGRTITQLMAMHEHARPPVFEPQRDDVQAIKFTGGTTGLPKGVMQPYRAWNANITNQIAHWRFGENERYVVSAPISHGTSTYVLPILAQGGCHVIPEQAGVEGTLHAFRERGGTVSFMPPTLVYMLMGAPGVSPSHFPALKRLIYGAAPMPKEKVREVREFFGPVLGTTYGQTEAPQIVTVMTPEDFESEENWASVGRQTWFTRVGIMSPDGALLPTGEIGEVVVRGDLVMTGYWRNEQKTAETLHGGWLRTGDRGLFDDRGYLYLKDRIKDMVITGGFNVYPVDVEGVLGRHEAVHECAVFGVPDGKWGETVQAAVQLRPGRSASEAELISFVKERLGSVQTPKRIHFYADLPRSPVGKVLKSDVLRDVLAQTEAAS
jgi:fatty-acyl-CoA synthase